MGGTTPSSGCGVGCETSYVGGPWSSGDYARNLNCGVQNTISIPGATEICLIFSLTTSIGAGDFLYIYTSGSFGGTQAPGSPFQGGALAGSTLHLSSDSARVCVTSDGGSTTRGNYSITQVCYSTGAAAGSYGCAGAPLYGTFSLDSTCCSTKSIAYKLNTANWTAVASQGPTGSTGYYSNTNIGTSGLNTIQVRISDLCGNTNLTSTIFTVAIPSPTINLLSPTSLIPLCGSLKYSWNVCQRNMLYK